MYIINKLVEEPETGRIIEVNGFTSGSYEKGIFCFTCDGKRVSFGSKPSNDKYAHFHYIEMEDIQELYKAFPEFMPPVLDEKLD
jgi:hypothetical protein